MFLPHVVNYIWCAKLHYAVCYKVKVYISKEQAYTVWNNSKALNSSMWFVSHISME
jgi:hypothetical protein